MPGPDSNIVAQAFALGNSTKSAGLALRASLLKASPEGEGFRPSQIETLRCAQTLHNGVRGSELATFDQSSHMAMLEEPDAYIRRLVDFLTRVEEATVKADA